MSRLLSVRLFWCLRLRRWRWHAEDVGRWVFAQIRCYGFDRHDLSEPVRGIRRCHDCGAREIEAFE
jgi:hypothetical protein